MKVKIVPLEVQSLFGFVEPSWGHTRRLCKILKSEYWRQVRLYLDWLRVVVQGGLEERNAIRRYAEYKKLAAQSTEFLWQRARLRLPRNERKSEGSTDNVTLLGGATLPTEVKEVLQKGPKFSFEPSTTRPELLAMVRQVADRAGEQHKERAIGDGVDFLKDTVSHLPRTKPPFEKVVGFLKQNDLSLVQADKEGVTFWKCSSQEKRISLIVPSEPLFLRRTHGNVWLAVIYSATWPPWLWRTLFLYETRMK
ncbi:hypothetical protein HPB47_007165 [Ixodes persulcatus]|uniref:Uncharacterized protein n=1 Tax=Ixodes persulcatus TaxID=34615 RepID=A0AC60P8C5_IXOPE|nr:hypothetical protein HPB47_007165 [Ixodes persulcatus]